MKTERSDAETVRLRVECAGVDGAEIAAAEAWETGASGVIEEDFGLTVYLPAAAVGELVGALEALRQVTEVASPVPVEEQLWSEAWKEHLHPVEISPRLVVTPSFAPFDAAEGQRVLKIEPGQAFGTGAHHSTRLALECLDEWLQEGAVGRVLDVGTGSGVLAIAAVALGAKRAVGFDIDPLAAPAARDAARANCVEREVSLFTGPLAAVRDVAFDVVVANLLRAELLPLVPEISARVTSGGAILLAGLLDGDGPAVLDAFAETGFTESSRRRRLDDDGESWLGLTLERAR